jgi:hypothetical protein
VTSPVRWTPGSYLDTVTTIVGRIGMENAPLAFALGRVDWASEDEMHTFLDALITKPVLKATA